MQKDQRNPQELTAREFKARYRRAGYSWTLVISYSIGARIALWAIRARVRPASISYASALTSVGVSVGVVILFGVNPIAAAAVALFGWQIAYGLDCADGPVARATGTASSRGAVLDLVCDWVSHVAVLAALIAISGPRWLGEWTPAGATIIAGIWFFALFYEGASRALDNSLSMKGGGSLLNAVRHGRDYGLQSAAVAVPIAFGRFPTLIVLVVLSLLNGLFLVQRMIVLRN